MKNSSSFALFLILLALTLWWTDSSPSMDGPRPYRTPETPPVCASRAQNPNPLLGMTQSSAIRRDLADWETKQEETKDQPMSSGLGQPTPIPLTSLSMASTLSSSPPEFPSQANFHTVVARQLAALFAPFEYGGGGGVADTECDGTIIS